MKGILFSVKPFDLFIRLLLKIYQILISDIVIIPAMCNDVQNDLKIARLFRKIIITDYYVSYYDTFVLDRKTYPQGSKIANRLRNTDYNIISKATLTFFLNTTEARRYLDLVGITFDKERHVIVPLVVEESIKCQLPYFNSPDLKGVIFNVCWWGSYIPLHGLDNILKAFQILKGQNGTKFHLYLFGTNDNKSKPYLNMIKELDISDVTTLYNEFTFKNGKLGEFLKLNCDLVLGNFGNSEKAKNVLVNKLLDGVAMKAPVLTGESIAPLEFFSEREIFYSKNSPAEIADMIYSISLTDKTDINIRIEKAYRVYLEHFSPSAFRNRLSDVFSRYE